MAQRKTPQEKAPRKKTRQPKTIRKEKSELSRDNRKAFPVVEPKQVKEALQTQARVLESMSEGVSVTNQRGTFVFTNPAFDAMFGYQPSELSGKHARVLNDYPPEENVRIIKQILKEINTKGAWFGEFQNRKKDGTPFFTLARISMLEVGGKKLYISVQEDITERKQAEREAQRLASFPQMNPNPVLEVSVSGSITYYNTATLKTLKKLGLPDEINVFLPQDLHEILKAAKEQGERQFYREVEVNGALFAEHIYFAEQFQVARLYAIDITEIRQAEKAERLNSARLSALLKLHQIADGPLEEITASVVEDCVRLTESQLGFVGFINEDETIMHAHLWSERAMAQCRVDGKPIYFSIDQGGLWAEPIRRRQPILLNDYTVASPYKKGYPEGHVALSRFLGVPILKGERVVAVAGVANKEQEYNNTDVQQVALLLEGMWDIMLQKRAVEELRKAHDELELLVQERTATLQNTLESLQLEMDERQQAEAALRESKQSLHVLAGQLMDAQESERKRLSRELHDELGQSLLVLKMQIRSLERGLSSDPELPKDDFSMAFLQLDEIIDNVRRLSKDLRPAILEDLGLKIALQNLFDSFVEHYGIKEFAVHLDDVQDVFPPEAQVNIYRIFQESLTNIGKHAHPTRVAAAIKRSEGEVFFLVEDNGTGFDLEEVLARDSREKGLGLATMEERLRILGGSLQIWSQKGLGTRINFRLPVPS